MADTGSFVHLARPLGPAVVGAALTTAPLNVVIQPQVSLRYGNILPGSWNESDHASLGYFFYP